MSLSQFLDPLFLIHTFGLIGVLAIVFAESGLFFGFFFPGDSLLFTAGLLASQGYLYAPALFIGGIIAAVLGDSVGFAFGKRIGPALFSRKDSLFFKQEYLARAKRFYDDYGVKTIILARFVPIVRTFAPIVAGVAGMNYKKFLTYNCIGGAAWVILLGSAGFILGRTVPGIDRYILPIVLVIIVVSILPGIPHILRASKGEQ